MDVKIRALSAGVLFFLSAQSFVAQKIKVDTVKDKEIDKVIITGYVKRKISNSTGSSQQLNSDNIKNPTQTNVESVLQGQVAGVQISAPSGTAGSVQDVRIRGVGSFTASSRPLYVIDGIPVNDQSFGNDDNTFSTLSPLASIPSEDIENITVLKDASATAAYGARGANGVIVITTKRGKSGNAKFSLSASYGFQNNAFSRPRMLSGKEKLELLEEALLNQKTVNTKDEALDFLKDNYKGLQSWIDEGAQDYNWFEAIKNKNAPVRDYAFSASGGNKAVKYYFSLNHNDTEGTVVGSKFKRTAANIKIDASLNPKTKVQTSFILSKVDQNPTAEQGGFFLNPNLIGYIMNPWLRPRNADGSPNITNITNYTKLYNPLYTAQNNIMNQRLLRAFVNNRIEYKLTKDLTLANNFALDYILADFKNYQNRVHSQYSNTDGYSYRSNSQNVNYVNQLSLNWVKRLGEDHRFDILALFEYQKNQTYLLEASGQKLPEGLTNIASASTSYRGNSSYEDFKNAAYLGMLNYTFKNRLVLDATFRREGSSKFAPTKRYGNFWSVGAGYNLNKDFSFNGLFNELKLRGSYGITGNSGISINEYQSFLTYNDTYKLSNASYPSSYGNSNLTWEKTRTYDLGLDFGVLENRFSGTISYFNKLTYDLLQEVEISRTTGFSSVRRNVGEMENRGWEFSLSADIFRGDFFKWNMYANFSTLHNEIKYLAKDATGRDLDLFSDSTNKGAELGKSYGHWRMRTFAGVNKDTGEALWYVNGVDGETTTDWDNAEAVDHGYSIPKYQGGVGTKIDIGSFFVNALVTFQGGNKIYDKAAGYYMRNNSFLGNFNGSAELLNRWQKAGDITDVPKIVYKGNDSFGKDSDRWLHDGTFARLRNLQVGYHLKSDYLKEIGLTGLTLQLTGTNLFTWVKDKSLKSDPETNSDGYIYLSTPPTKTVMAGVTINF